MRRHPARVLLGLAIALVFVGHAARLYTVDLIDRLDHIVYDARLRLTMPGAGSDRVVILAIDEKSLGEVGRWPWGRDVMARLMDRLFERYRVSLVAFDVLWSERDTSSGIGILDALGEKELRDVAEYRAAYGRLRGALDYDGRFAASMKGRPVVLGYYLSSEAPATRVNAIPAPALDKTRFGGRAVGATRWAGYTGNLPEYQANAAAAGHFNPIVDDDGVVRRVPVLAELDGEYYEALSLAVLRTYLARQSEGRQPPVAPVFPDGAATPEWLQVGPHVIPVDENLATLVPFHGPRGSFAYHSVADVLAGRVPEEALRDRIVLVGATAPGLMDLRATPVASVYPGVEIHANMVAGLLGNSLKMRPDWVLGAEVVLLLAGGTALALLIPALSALWATVAVALAAAAIAGFNLLMWSEAGLVLPLAAALLMTALIYTMNMAYGYFVESRTKRQVAERFGQYVPPEVVDRIVAEPGKYTMEPRDAELTILFSDVRGFTGISESLGPGALRDYINEYLTDMSGVIRTRHGGTLDKYIGDAIMAFWGAPLADPQHARNGVLAALEMQEHCRILNQRFRARGWPPLAIGVGLNSGLVRVGDMGSQVRRAYTAMGDAVNVASRLEGRTKYYGVGILAGEATRRAVPDVVFREVDRIRVKGRDEPLVIHEPLAPSSALDAAAAAELAEWEDALKAYREREWTRLEAAMQSLLRRSPASGLYRLYAERAARYRREPPPQDWAGVTSFDEK